MYEVVIIGAGRIGSSIAKLLYATGEYRVTLADRDPEALQAATTQPGISLLTIDIDRQGALLELLKQGQLVISACGYDANLTIARAALQAGVSYFDLTEDIATSNGILDISTSALPGQLFVPQCGLAPGFIGILGYHMYQQFDVLHELKLRVGALPEFPHNSLMYNLTWSTQGLINEYCNPCHAIRAGEYVELTPLEGLETFSLGGTSYEAFNTSGWLGTLCQTLQGRVQDLTYKTIRYKGHQYLMNFLINDLKLGERRELLMELFEDAVAVTKQDMVLVMATATGMIDGNFMQQTESRKIMHQSVCGEEWGAIQITTASALCVLIDLFFEGRLPERGYVRQEQIDYQQFINNRFAECYRPSS